MKALLSFCFIAFAFIVHAQVSDSIEIKLQHYKELYSKNLINAKEYQRLKSRTLHIPLDINTDPDSIRARALQDRYRGRITGGAIMIGGGMGMIIGAVITDALVPPDNYAWKPRGERRPFLYLGATGGISAIVGGVIFGLGIRDRFIFCNDYVVIGFTFDDNQPGLACNF